jgi:hypothetical protein
LSSDQSCCVGRSTRHPTFYLRNALPEPVRPLLAQSGRLQNGRLWNDRSEVHLRWRAGANLGSLRSLANARFGTDLCSGLKGCDDGLCRGGEFSARTFAAGGLTADAGAFQEKGEGVG